MTSETLAEPILVGREREIEELKLCLAQALSGKGVTVFISGEAGAGKTRLITEFLNIAKKKRVTVLTGWCLSDVAIPYFPFIEAFDTYISNNEDDGVSIANQQLSLKIGLIGNQSEANKTLGNTSPEAWKDQAFRAVAQELLFLSTKKPLILILEDLHWADSASLALLHYLARAVYKSERILVMATFRSEELTADAEGHPHPLVETLRMMRREDLFTEIKLTGLTQANVADIAANMIGGNLQPKLAEKLAAESRGNPLFVVESLRMWHERKSLVAEDNEWRLAVDELGVPSKIKDIILRRIAVLKYAQRRVLDAASVIGEKFDVELLSTVLGLDSLEVLETLNVLAHSTSLVSVEENCYRFDHARSRETLYDELSAPLKRAYHARIAEKLESTKSPTLPLNDLAYHYAQAGNREKAAEYALRAGEDALARWSNEEAIKHFTYVLESVSETPENAETRRKAQEGLGDAYYANCMFEQAIRSYEELARIETGTIKLRALRKEMEAVWYKEMDSSHLMELVKQAELYAISDRLESARVRWNRGRALLWLGDIKFSLSDHEEALRVFEEEGSLIDAALALWGTGITRVILGSDEEKGLGEILRGISIHQELGDAHGELLAWKNGGVDIFHLCGLFQEARANAANVLRLGQQIGDFDNIASTWVSLSDISELTGHLAEALTQALKAQEFALKTDSKGTQCKTHAILAKLYALQNDIKKAEKHYDEVMKTPPEVRLHPRNILYVAFSLAVFFAVKNQWTEAENALKQVHEAILKTYPHSLEVQYCIRFYRALVLHIQGKAEEAKVLNDEAQRILEEAEKKYEKVNVQANLMAPREASVGEEFEMRFDIVNVSKKSGSLLEIEKVLPSQFQVATSPSYCKIKESDLEFKEGNINPFQVKTIKLKVKASRTGSFSLEPQLIFVNDLRETKACKLKPAKITIKQALPTMKAVNVENASLLFELKSEAAQKAIDFLIRAFEEDYVRRKLPQERAGWRTLMDLVKQGQLTQYSVYGSVNHRGIALSELEHSGLVQTRIFSGERGRGGKILKLRIAYEKEDVRQYINQCSSALKNIGNEG